VAVDVHVFAFVLVISILTGVAFGLAPVLAARRVDLSGALKECGRSGGSVLSPHRLGSLLVVAEVTLALILLIGAGLLIKSFARLSSVDPGFHERRALTFSVSLPYTQYESSEQQVAFFREASQKLEALPGVESAALTSLVPLGGDDALFSLEFPERPAVPRSEIPVTLRSVISPNYFRTMDIPLISGRAFTDRDTDTARPVAIISRDCALSHFPNESPIGRRIILGPSNRVEREIVGVVEAVKHYALDRSDRSQVYVPFAQWPMTGMSFVLSTTVDELSLTGAVRKVIQSVDAQQPAFFIRSLDQIMSDSAAMPRMRSLLLGLFAAVALLLSAVGLYGVMSYAVTQRTREIGIRMALGAGRSDILKMVVRRGMTLTFIGVVLGTIGSVALTRLLSRFLFDVSTTDPGAFAAMAIVLGAAALLACTIPARRAARVDPMAALRFE